MCPKECQTVLTLIRLLLKEQSDLGLHCLLRPICPNILNFDVILRFLGDDEGSLVSDEERREVVSLDTWLNKPDVIYSCQCREVDSSGFVHPRYCTV